MSRKEHTDSGVASSREDFENLSRDSLSIFNLT